MIECGFYHGDCMDYLPDMPDKSIDLAICDPPYGINVGQAAMGMGGGKAPHRNRSARRAVETSLTSHSAANATQNGGGRESAEQSHSERLLGLQSAPKSTRRLTTAARQTPHILNNCGE